MVKQYLIDLIDVKSFADVLIHLVALFFMLTLIFILVYVLCIAIVGIFQGIAIVFKKEEIEPVNNEPARGVIAKAESEFRVVTLEHTGGDNFEIWEKSKLGYGSTGRFRRLEHRAFVEYRSLCAMVGAK